MISRETGQIIDEDAHIRQSIGDILTTPKGTRLMRRDYGSNLLSKLSLPQTESAKTAIIAETAKALQEWEPRIDVAAVGVEFKPSGGFHLKINFSKKSNPEALYSVNVGVN